MGAKPANPADRRVLRTRRTLREALIALLLERGWDGVSVQDVCARANVGRSTFYAHFADKEELLLGGFADLRKLVRARLLPPAGTGEPLRFARGLIDHAYENRALFRALVGKRSGQVVLQRFRELLLSLVREDLHPRLPAGPSRDAAVHFVAGGFLELLSWWLESRNSLGPEEIEREFLGCALRVVPARPTATG